MAEPGRSSRSRALIAILVFVAVTAPLSWWWIEGGDALYARFFEAVARPLYEVFGFGPAFFGPRLRYMNYIPFVGLVLATPGLGASRRLRGVGVGLVVLFVSHVLFNLSATRETGFQLNEATAVLSDALPIVLWALIAREELVRLGVRAFGRTPSTSRASTPASGVEGSDPVASTEAVTMEDREEREGGGAG